MSRRGNSRECKAYPLGCDAPMESFWGTLKNELVHHRKFEIRQQARQEIGEYIEVFHNRQRKQKKLGICHQQNIRSDTMQHCALLNPLDSMIDSRGYCGS